MSFFNRLKNFYVTGTTSAHANEAMRTKKENPWLTGYVFPIGFVQKGMYIESLDREGLQYNRDEAEQLDDSSTEVVITNVKAIKVGRDKVVEAFLDGDDYLSVRAGIIGIDGMVDWGVIVKRTLGVVTDIDLCVLSEGVFAVSFIDIDQHAYVEIGSISGSTITFGAIKDVSLTDAVSGKGTAVCSGGVGKLVACFTLGSDNFGHATVVEYSGVTASTLGETVAFEDTPLSPRLSKYDETHLVVIYQDEGASDMPVTVNTLTLNGTDIVIGTAESLAGTAGVATCIDIRKGVGSSIVACWIDNGDPHLRAATISGVTLTWGTEVTITTDNAGYLAMDVMEDNKIILVWENTSQDNYLYSTTVKLSGSTLTKSGYLDVAVEAESIYNCVVALNSKDNLILFADAGNSNYLTEQYTQFKNHLIDIRSTSASISFAGYILSKREDSMGKFQCKKITGTTHATANTQMATQSTLPWNNCREVVVLFKDKGCYVYNNGTSRRKSGVSLSGRTIDVRSTSTSVAFEAYVIRVANDPMAISVAQA